MDFEQLPREISPPAALEDRTASALRDQGLLRQNPRLLSRTWQRIAAAIAIFAAGAWFGVAWDVSGPPAPEGPRFLLLLAGAPAGAGEEARVFEEYRAWAGTMRTAGRFVAGARLGRASVAVPTENRADSEPVQGYFIISAKDIGDAAAVAESSPHVARGGQVIVRPIDMQ